MSTARTFRHGRSILPGGHRTHAARRLSFALIGGVGIGMLAYVLAMGVRLHADLALHAGAAPARWFGWWLVLAAFLTALLPVVFLWLDVHGSRRLRRTFTVDEDGIVSRDGDEVVRIRWKQVRQLREARWAPRGLVVLADHARIDVSDSFIDEDGPHADHVRRIWGGRMSRVAFLAQDPIAQSRELRNLVKEWAPRAELIRWPPFDGILALPLVVILLVGLFLPFYRLRAFEAVDAADVRLHCHDAAGALAEADRALRIEPGWGLAHAARAEALAALDRGDEALVEADRAVALDPQVADVHRVRARILEKAGRPEEAAREMLHVGIAGQAGRAWRKEVARLLDAGRQASTARSPTSAIP
jgi:hypothetical protein